VEELERRIYAEAGIDEWLKRMIEREVARVPLGEQSVRRAELVDKVLQVRKKHRRIRHPKAYWAQILRNERVNRFRKIAKQRREVNIVEDRSGAGDAGDAAVIVRALERDTTRALAIAKVLKRLSAEQRLLLQVLEECRWKKARAARRLRVHRNTVQNRLRRIQEILTHGLQISL
jgi:DNA-directed RNA polymerase specialized sigma24 family protein